MITAESMDIVILLRATGSMVFSCSMGIVSDGCSGDFTLMDTGMEGLVITAGFTVDSTDMDEGNLDSKDAINGFTVSFLGMEVIFVGFIGAGTGMRGLVMLTVAAAVMGFEVGITGVDVDVDFWRSARTREVW